MLEDGPTACERCGGVLRRVLYPTGIIFKGSGFYRTDSRAASSSTSDGGAATASGSSSKEKGSGDGAPAVTPRSATDTGSGTDKGSTTEKGSGTRKSPAPASGD